MTSGLNVPWSVLATRRSRWAPGVVASAVMLLVACGPSPEGDGEAAQETRVSEASPTVSPAEALIARSIAYHDPSNAWPEFEGTLSLEELRPDGSGRTAEVALDVPSSGFEYRATMDGLAVVKTVADGVCAATVDGATPSAEEVERLRLGCDQLERSRNYYLYLWGLPMKLRDPGTILDESVAETDFQGQSVLSVRATYDPSVGSDTWYFYFEPATAALVGYRFFHDESAGDGEYIVLEDVVPVGSMRLPARRSWFVNADGRFLGEDVLQRATTAG